MAFSDFKTIPEVQERFGNGIVTDGKLWEFGQLVGDTFIQNRTNFTIDNLPTLFGAMNSVFKAIQEH